MNSLQILTALALYTLQSSLFLILAIPLPRLLGLRLPDLRLAYYYMLLLCTFFLPFFAWLAPVSRVSPIPEDLQIEAVISASLPGSTTSPIPALILAGLVLIWTLRTLWMGAGFLVLARYAAGSKRLVDLPAPLADLRSRLSPRAEIRMSNRIQVPVSFGWKNPFIFILVPQRFSEFPEDRQRAILCHELLHLKRCDWPLAIVEHVIRTAFWFHPPILLLLERIHLSREQLIDREVVRVTGNARAYLDALRRFAETFRKASLTPAIPFVLASHLKRRVALLTQEVCMSRKRQFVVCSVLLASVAALSLLAVAAFPSSGTGGSPIGSRFALGPGKEAAVLAPLEEAGEEQDRGEQGKIGISDETGVRTRLVKKVNPIYPPEAKEKRITGKVICKSKIDEGGKVFEVTVQESPHELLSQAAMEAVRQWEYEPVQKDGKPVSFVTTVTINFVLE